MAHRIVWFDIPVLDLDRAIRFYSAVLGVTVERHDFQGGSLGVLPHRETGSEESGESHVGGCLVLCNPAENGPSGRGPLLYFNVEGRLAEAEQAVEPQGGRVVHPAHSIGPYGRRAIVMDSEGNRIALHSK